VETNFEVGNVYVEDVEKLEHHSILDFGYKKVPKIPKKRESQQDRGHGGRL